MRPANTIAYALITLVGAALIQTMYNITAPEYIRMFTAFSEKLVRFTQ